MPTGPPSPQLGDQATLTPNGHTLLMKPGDVIKVQMFDARIKGGHALEAKETDLTTGKSGFMIASAANGFMNTNPFDCSGTPFNFQPEYSSARAQNIIPWGVGPYMINSEFEVGHFEACTSLSGLETSTGDDYYTNCLGPYETAAENPNLEPALLRLPGASRFVSAPGDSVTPGAEPCPAGKHGGPFGMKNRRILSCG